MKDKKQAQSYICSSADWDCLVEAAESPMEAAIAALNRQINSSSNGFSVGASIEVIPVKLNKKDSEYIYSPFVLADIGMHKFAKDLAEKIGGPEDLKKNNEL
jgi:hypothetical protein